MNTTRPHNTSYESIGYQGALMEPTAHERLRGKHMEALQKAQAYRDAGGDPIDDLVRFGEELYGPRVTAPRSAYLQPAGYIIGAAFGLIVTALHSLMVNHPGKLLAALALIVSAGVYQFVRWCLRTPGGR